MWRFLIATALLAFMGVHDADAAPKKGKGKGKKGGGKPLTMKQGTMQLGGQVSVDLTSAGGNTNIGLTLAPNGGYFVADNLEVLASLGLHNFGGATTWEIGAGARYFLDLDGLWGYGGAMLGYGDIGGGNPLIVTLQPGVLYPLSKNVGLDLGVPVKVISANGSTTINVSVGYLGVQAFFK